MSEKFTKGPWHVEIGEDEDDGDIYVCHQGTECDETTIVNFEEPTDEDAANAHLIAAAPELYEALLATLEYIDAIPNESVATFPTMPGISRDWVDGVLAKARGES